MKKVVIVGAGIAGLAAGIYARQSGFEVQAQANRRRRRLALDTELGREYCRARTHLCVPGLLVSSTAREAPCQGSMRQHQQWNLDIQANNP